MSKLNANAFSFVPGQFRLPQQQPQQPAQPPPPPIERPPQTEAPAPPPTISLNIGGAKPAPPPAAAPSQPATISLNIGGSKPVTPAPSAPAPARAPPKVDAPAPEPVKATPGPAASASNAAGSKSFTLERAKTDSNAIAHEVRNVADDEVLKDLYGNGECCPRYTRHLSSEHDLPPISQGAPKHRLHWSRRCGEEHHGR